MDMFKSNKERDPEAYNPFEDKYERTWFLRKVFSIVLVQMLFTAIIVALFMYVDPLFKFTRENYIPFFICAGITIFISFIIMCCDHWLRIYPCNVIILIIDTFTTSITLAYLVNAYYPTHVFIAVAITVLLVAALTIFAIQTKFDFTKCGPFIMIALIIIFIMGIVMIFFRNYIMMVVYASLGSLIYSFVLIFIVQLMLRQEYGNGFQSDEYVLAALILYSTIITLFRFILTLMGLISDGE